MPSIVLVGGFFGDEGKGKIVSYLSKNDNPSIVVILLTKFGCYQADF